jgi:hypothetical protein
LGLEPYNFVVGSWKSAPSKWNVNFGISNFSEEEGNLKQSSHALMLLLATGNFIWDKDANLT